MKILRQGDNSRRRFREERKQNRKKKYRRKVTKRMIMKAVFIKIKIGKSGGKSSFYKQTNLAKCFQKTDGHHMPVKAL